MPIGMIRVGQLGRDRKIALKLNPNCLELGSLCVWEMFMHAVQKEKLRALQQRPSVPKVLRVRNWNIVDDTAESLP